MSWERIPGWTNPDMLALYDETAARLGDEPGLVVEVGVAYGRSLAYIAGRCSASVQIYGIDLWGEHMGGDNLPADVFARMQAHGDPRSACIAEMTAAGVFAPGRPTPVHLLQGPSVKLSAIFNDASCDLVLIDARHEYDEVLADIAAWRPKVRPGGVLAGDDYDPEVFPGVVRAVRDALGSYQVRGRVWQVQA